MLGRSPKRLEEMGVMTFPDTLKGVTAEDVPLPASISDFICEYFKVNCVVLLPLGLTEPFIVAVLSPIEEAGNVMTNG